MGEEGKILHFDGTEWHAEPGDTLMLLHSVWGSSSSDVYVSGEGLCLHSDGGPWRSVDLGVDATFYSIWGSDSSDVYVSGITPQGYVVGTVVLQHFDGRAWSTEVVPSTGDGLPIGLVGTSSTEIIMAVMTGSEMRILHSIAGAWEARASIPVSTEQRVFLDGGMWGNPAAGIYLAGAEQDAGLRWKARAFSYDPDVASWSEVATWVDVRAYDVWGVSDSQLWVVGSGGNTWYFDGETWIAQDSGLHEVTSALPLGCR